MVDVAADMAAHPAEKLIRTALDYALPAPVCIVPDSLWNVPTMLFQERLCLRAAISRILGLGIVLGAGLIKLPQIYNVISAGSVAGLSTTSFLVDTFGYTYNLAAHYRQRYPLSTYGDFVVLMAQNYLLLYLCYAYRGRSARGLATLAGYVALLGFFCGEFCPLEIVQTLTLFNVPVVFVSRIPQIYANYANKNTGTLSALSSWGVFLGAIARIFTTLQEVDSVNILLGYVASALMNGIVAIQILMYRGNAPPKDEKKKQ